jgi:thymidylate synthase (FAD)
VREVTPEVYLISKPSLDFEAMLDYLDTVDGREWAERNFDTGAGRDPQQGDGEDLIEFGGRLCYRSWKPGLNANVTKVREDSAQYLGHILEVGHGSVLEHANYTFVFHNVSRVFTHELVRHRAGTAFSQESMRFVRLTDIPFWFPEWSKQDPEFMALAKDLLMRMEEFQVYMADHFGLDDEGVPFEEKKAKTSFMRRFAPDGVATSIQMTANVRALRHMITMRTDKAAEEEIRIVFDQVAEIMAMETPNLFQDFGRDADTGMWTPDNKKV